MQVLDIIKKLTSLSPRQFERESLTAEYICRTLEKKDIVAKIQAFDVAVPDYVDYYLKVDGKRIKCMPTAFKSGKIDKTCDLISSLDFSYEDKGRSNINFNPYCEEISLANFYDSPSLAISRKDVDKIRKAKKIDGWVDVARKIYKSCNILVGNLKDPRNVIFAHYDGFFQGALDNASGPSVCIGMIMNDQSFLRNNLFVFCGAEELSFDKPDYWGRCFRIFENKYFRILHKAKKIIIIDCVGNDDPDVVVNKEIVPLYFPIRAFGELRKRIYVISSAEKDQKWFMSVYHSKSDTIGCIREKYLKMAEKLCIKLCK